MGHVKLIVASLLLQKFLVRTRLDDMPLLHDHNLVRVPDGGKAVGDDQTGTAFHQLHHGVLDLLFGTGIHAGGSLVQDQDERIA